MPSSLLKPVARADITLRLQQEYDATLALRDADAMHEVGANAPELMA